MTAVVRSHWVNGEVLANHQWTNRLFSLRIKAPLLPFKAGQFVRLQLPIEQAGKSVLVAKPYSLLNAPDDTEVAEVFYNTVPGGALSQALASLRAGDALEVSQPASGFFVLDEVPAAQYLWMMATGTGLGPYLSILKTAQVWKRFEKVILVHGVPLRSELVYADLIQTFSAQHPLQFQFISCVSRDTNPDGLVGRMTTHLASGALEQKAGISINSLTTQVMLCGNHNMLNDMKKMLEERSLQRHLRHKPGHITTEQYF
ncbi:ferredoxin--NADP reductase [Candidatus Thiothrix anitrata]|jgi:ferredoxin--NADP+ reductase|uniref:ferredoxin--NADP(+) reductase n=1 Tax=Candidatus Thiothrix anitrata TaxID=2823902 RepID=A0ABX7X3S5_9GAMM|nr:ferredoxin--NADP reductase [Candidatus Thiothrix anitrata]QTR49263.1 ferredoxin--NADP reductase [Candidatus Thiothrix anitrata]